MNPAAIMWLLKLFFAILSSDNPCAARKIAKKSVVCVCNATYCDTITKEHLTAGQYVVYKSSQVKYYRHILTNNINTKVSWFAMFSSLNR